MFDSIAARLAALRVEMEEGFAKCLAEEPTLPEVGVTPLPVETHNFAAATLQKQRRARYTSIMKSMLANARTRAGVAAAPAPAQQQAPAPASATPATRAQCVGVFRTPAAAACARLLNRRSHARTRARTPRVHQLTTHARFHFPLSASIAALRQGAARCGANCGSVLSAGLGDCVSDERPNLAARGPGRRCSCSRLEASNVRLRHLLLPAFVLRSATRACLASLAVSSLSPHSCSRVCTLPLRALLSAAAAGAASRRRPGACTTASLTCGGIPRRSTGGMHVARSSARPRLGPSTRWTPPPAPSGR